MHFELSVRIKAEKNGPPKRLSRTGNYLFMDKQDNCFLAFNEMNTRVFITFVLRRLPNPLKHSATLLKSPSYYFGH